MIRPCLGNKRGKRADSKVLAVPDRIKSLICYLLLKLGLEDERARRGFEGLVLPYRSGDFGAESEDQIGAQREADQ